MIVSYVFDPAFAMTRAARRYNRFAGASQRGQVCWIRRIALLDAYSPCPPQVVQVVVLVPGLGAAAVADLALRQGGDRIRFRCHVPLLPA